MLSEASHRADIARREKTMKPQARGSRLIPLQFIHDGRDGCLTVAESGRQIPFEIKRVYYINQLKNRSAVRGKHAHKTLKQIILCLQGFFSLKLDNGKRRQRIEVRQSSTGVYLAPKVWHEMSHFSKDCVILVLASDFYKESDYIRDYNEFKRVVRKNS